MPTASPRPAPPHVRTAGRSRAALVTCTAFLTLTTLTTLTAAPAGGQQVVGGWLLDRGGTAPLPCASVALVDSAERIVARTGTARDGAFQFDPPAGGTYHLHFLADEHDRVTEPDTLTPGSERAVRYAVGFTLRPPGSGASLVAREMPGVPAWEPPRPMPNTGGPRYPREMLRARRNGVVWVRYVVDASGQVEPDAVAVLATTDAAFTDAVVRYLRTPGRRLTPARRGDTPVCALVEQPFEFAIAGARPLTMADVRVHEPPKRP